MSAIDELTAEFAKLPGIGRKTAARLTFHLLKQPKSTVDQLASAIHAVSERVALCGECGTFSELDPCDVCADPKRNATMICVVEDAADVASIEQTGEYRGKYHVLGGHISPLDGIGPDDLRVDALCRRLQNGHQVSEVILATNPSMEGEVTATYLREVLDEFDLRVTRIALGLPIGGDLEYADRVTIAQAMAARRQM